MFRSGPIVDLQGKVLGTYGGVAGYTIGQRKGLHLALGRSLYVVDLDAERDTVVVGDAVDLERDRLVGASGNFIACAPQPEPVRVAARVPHNHRPALGSL